MPKTDNEKKVAKILRKLINVRSSYTCANNCFFNPDIVIYTNDDDGSRVTFCDFECYTKFKNSSDL